MATADETLARIDPLYFLDYAIFTGVVRHYASKTLEEAFKADSNPLRRRLHFINLVKEEYAAYEDAGSMLKAFLDYRSDKVTIPLKSLMDFKARDVQLAEVFDTYRVHSGEDLWRALKLTEWIPAGWAGLVLPPRFGEGAAAGRDFFVADCVQNQKRHGIVAYNKIKHGLLVISSGRQYRENLPDAPAVILWPPRQEQPPRPWLFWVRQGCYSNQGVAGPCRLLEADLEHLRMSPRLSLKGRNSSPLAVT